MSHNEAQPFAGIKIIDCTHVLAGPLASYILGMLGADVIRVDHPEGTDFIRNLAPPGPFADMKIGPYFLGQNANKRSLSLNLKTLEGQEILRDLASNSDILFENFRPGKMAKLSLGYDDIKAVNDQIIYCSITGFGQTGPLKDRPAYDHIIQAMSGMMSVTGSDESGPMRVGYPITDYLAGIMATLAAVTALFQRSHAKSGQYIDVSMLDSAIALMAPAFMQFLLLKKEMRLPGNEAFSGSAFSGVFNTADDDLVIVANTAAQARRLNDMLELKFQDFQLDPQVGKKNPQTADAIRSVIEGRLLTKGAEYWAEQLAQQGIPAGRVRNIGAVVSDPHVLSRGLFMDAPSIDGLNEKLRVPGLGFKLATNGVSVNRAPPLVGEHSEEILVELGYSKDEILVLSKKGVI